MSSLNLYDYNSKIIDTTYQNVGFLFNLEQIPISSKRGLGHLGFNANHFSPCREFVLVGWYTLP